MKKLLKRRSIKLGAPPGSLIYTGESTEKVSHITLFVYDSDHIVETHPRTIDEALEECKNKKKAWLHISGIHDPILINSIGKFFKLHPLLLEDIMSPGQRSKLDDYKNHLYIATHILNLNNNSLEDEQLSLVVGENIVISFSEKQTDFLNPIQARLLKPASRMRQRGTDYIAYAILDCIVDNYFVILENIDQKLEGLENAILLGSDKTIMFQIQSAKRELALLRKTIWPMREVVNQFRRIDSPLIQETTRIYVYDVYDHAVQAIETVESFRELASGMHDIHLTAINQKMNETMKILTILATIFVPLTFITGLYGMNFDKMPGVHSPFGFPLVICGMVLLVIGMLTFFRRKEWI